MVSDIKTSLLQQLGLRLRELRLSRNESQARFAARVGVSIPTLRRMEQGDPSAQIGHWLTALEILDRYADFEQILAPRYSLFDIAAEPKKRQRARRRL